jgi:hypothetical protein
MKPIGIGLGIGLGIGIGSQRADARRNLLTYTEQFDNAEWGKNFCTITANSIIAPDGATTADKLVEGLDVAQQHDVRRLSAVSALGTYTFSVYAKAAERTRIALGQFASPAVATVFDIQGGTVIGAATGYGAAASAAIASAGSGWYRCSITQATTDTQSFFITTVQGSGTLVFYDGDGASGVHLWGAQLELGSAVTAYQVIVAGT